MPIIILMYLGAAAVAAGGPLAGYLIFDSAQRKRAAYLAEQDRANLEALLLAEIDHAELVKRAEAAGVDAAEVKAGYEALRKGGVTLGDVIKQLGSAA